MVALAADMAHTAAAAAVNVEDLAVAGADVVGALSAVDVE